MRIVFFLQDTGAIYGAERAHLDLASGLVRHGQDVHFFLIEETRFDLGPALRQELQRRELKYSLLPCGGRCSRALLTGLRAHVTILQPDVIHTVGYKADVHAAWALPGFGRPVRVATVHGWLERPDWKERFYKFLNRRALRVFDAVIVLSRFYAERLRSMGIPTSRVFCIPTGLDSAKYPRVDIARELFCSPHDFTVGMLGRLSWEKNHGMLLKALALLRQRGVSIRACMAGDGPERLNLLAKAAELKISEWVTWLGYTEPETFFQHVDVLVSCSRIENLPYSMLEAMAWCRPVIATDVGGVSDLVVHGETGYLVASDDVVEMANRIEFLANHSNEIQRLGIQARARLEKGFTLDRCVDDHLQLYARLAKINIAWKNA